MKWTGWICVFIFIVSCSDQVKPPRNLIPEKKMESIMWDMVQADRFATTFITRDSLKLNVRQETFKMYDQVFQLHNISREQFVESYKYYLSQPDLSQKIFDSVASKASRARIDANKPAQAKP